jgi:hypothetical protein
MRLAGNPRRGKFAVASTAFTSLPTPRANRVSVALGDKEMMQFGGVVASLIPALATGSAKSEAPITVVMVTRHKLFMFSLEGREKGRP